MNQLQLQRAVLLRLLDRHVLQFLHHKTSPPVSIHAVCWPLHNL
jgi:hypothetical protein